MAMKAIVTGGSRGIGAGIVRKLAEEGYDLAFSFHTEGEKAEVLCREMRECFGIRCACFQAALEETGAGKEFFDQAVHFLGGLDLLVNNAGVTKFESLLELTEETMDYMINLDFRNYIILMREAAQFMLEHETKGAIVNITSSRGERAYPRDGIYGGLKAGLNRAVQSFALDVAPYGIRINNVAPGAIRIRQGAELRELMKEAGADPELDFWDDLGPDIPLGRSGESADIAEAVAFLASEAASYITGVTLRVDGGLILPGMPEMVPEGRNARYWGAPRPEKETE